MKAKFTLHYRAAEGTRLQIVGEGMKPLDMCCDADDIWSAMLDIPRGRLFGYSYRVMRGRTPIRTEWGEGLYSVLQDCCS